MSAKKSKSKTALRGAVNNIIMESLIDGEKYGYEIIKEVEDKTDGKVKLKQPSLYSSLKRFETKGYIESYWQDSEIGGKRHYYKLTPDGEKYYKKYIAKEIDDDFEEVDDEQVVENDNDEYLEDTLSNYEIDEEDTGSDLSKYEYNVEDKLNSLLNDDKEEFEDKEESDEELLDELYNTIDDEVIYSEDDLKEDQVQEEVIADHEFRHSTPITDVIEQSTDEVVKSSNSSDNALNDILDKESDSVFDDIDLDSKPEPQVEEPTTDAPTKAKIFTDSDGITRMYYDDDEKKQNNKIFDNVVYRTNSQDIYSSINKTKKQTEEKPLTDEEKELKSKRFFEKFDSKSEQIIREKQLSKASEPEPEKVETKIDYNYKSKLNSLFDSMSTEENIEETNLGNDTAFDFDNSDDEDKFVDFDSNFNSDTNYANYVEDEPLQPVTSENTEDYSIKVYSQEKLKDPTIKYLQVNKAKFSFGLAMMIFMLFQITIMLILFKNKGLIINNQFWVFQLSYIIVGIATLLLCVPVFISPNKQANNTFKLGYSLTFGVLAFFIIVILTYAINTFMGMELFNIKYYLATLIVPIVMAFNFVLGPLIYWITIQNKRFY